jgi:intracellular multiplication protein IcmJ
MTLGEPVLRVKKSLWRREDPESGGKPTVPPDIRKLVIERDRGGCAHCGFAAEKWQEIHHLDDDHHNNDPNNLATLCPWCHGCHHVGFMGMSGKMRLIHLPGIRQTTIFHFVRILFVGAAIDFDDKMKIGSACRSLYGILASRTKDVVAAFGPESDNPAGLGNILLENEVPEDRIAGFRLIPEKGKVWQPLVQYWARSVFADHPPLIWAGVLSQIEKKLNEVPDSPNEEYETESETGSSGGDAE